MTRAGRCVHNYDRILYGGGVACTFCDEVEPSREALSSVLWRLHLYRLCGWWDAGSDARRRR